VEPILIYNNTVMGGRWGVVGGTNMLILNNIFQGASQYGVRMVQANSRVAYNDLFGNAQAYDATSQSQLAEGMLYSDPLLDTDYRPLSSSSVVDAGIAHYSHNGQVMDVTDFLGSAPDMGAYEYGGGAAGRTKPPR